jgi:hypothetical protein
MHFNAPVAQLDQSIWLRTRGSGVRVSPGAPLLSEIFCREFQARALGLLASSLHLQFITSSDSPAPGKPLDGSDTLLEGYPVPAHAEPFQ